MYRARAAALLSFSVAVSVAGVLAVWAFDPLEPLKRILVPKPVFVSACRNAYAGARERVTGKGTLVPLTEKQKDALAVMYGAKFVSAVEIRYNAPTPAIKILGMTLSDPPAAITFGRRVYFKAAPRPESRAQVSLLAHEFFHVSQYQKGHFGERYCSGLYDADFRYASNIMEKEAYAAQKAFSELLRETGQFQESKDDTKEETEETPPPSETKP